MGTSSWSHTDWAGYSTRTATKSTAQIFTSRGMNEDLDPSKFDVRESRDSDAHPDSTPIIIAVDVTGSMGIIAESIVRKGLGVLVEEILDRKPVTDPHTMIAAIGDAHCDIAPLQATQFETDIVLTEQIEKVWLEGHGGGNSSESYHLAWYLAAFKTATDASAKGRKGYLFTVGDEGVPPALTTEQIKRVCGGSPERDLTTQELFDAASRDFHCYHVVIEEGYFVKSNGLDYVMGPWQKIMGERVLPLSDHTKLAEVIVSTIEVNEGADRDAVASSWGGDTSLTVARATKGMVASGGTATGVTRL